MVRASCWIAVVAAALLLALMASSAPARAFGEPTTPPLVGLWCGMTTDGGSVRLTVTDDARFVRKIEVRTVGGSIVQSEGYERGDAQIKDGRFLWRGSRTDVSATIGPIRTPGNPGRCVRAPCHPISGQPGGGSTTTTSTVTVRGTFQTPDNLDGSYTGLTTVTGGAHPGSTRQSGEFTAWPASLASCP
jgi:hypothetical protein